MAGLLKDDDDVMRRWNEAVGPYEMPGLDTTDEDELAYLRAMLGMIGTGDMFHGRFVEVHVARAIGGDLPDTGIAEWDIWVERPAPLAPFTVEVKATSNRSFTTDVVGKKKLHRKGRLDGKRSDLWVFVAYESKTTMPRSFKYAVALAAEVKALNQKTMSASKLFRHFGEIEGRAVSTPEQLAAVVWELAPKE